MDLPTATRSDVAVLVDGDNLSKGLAAILLKTANNHGTVRVRRVYGAISALSGWEDQGFRLCPTRPGKNAADMLLCVEAMILALRDGFKTLIIASSDRDFSYLAEQLREMGHQVVGMGEAKAPLSFQRACSAFTVMSLPKQNPETPLTAAPLTIEGRISQSILQAGKAGLLISKLGAAAINGGFKVSESPEKSWRKWLEARSALFVCDPKGPEARVRLKT